jgi:hypothetical protein
MVDCSDKLEAWPTFSPVWCVIDCGTYIAGPAAAVILSDFGAEVIKVERPPAGDPFRMLWRTPGLPAASVNYCWVLTRATKRASPSILATPLGVTLC